MAFSKALMSAAVGVVLAAAAHGQSLDETLALAELSNPSLDVSETDARIAREALEEARAQGRVNVSVSGQAGFESLETNQPFAFQVGERATAAASLEAALPIYTGGRVSAGVRAAEAGIDAADARLEAQRQAIYLQAISAFLNVTAGRATVDIRENNVRLLEEQVEAAQARFRVGFITRTDVALSEARLAGARAGLAFAEAELERFEADFEAVTDVRPGALGPVPPAPVLPLDFDEALAILQEGNPQLIALREDAQAASEVVEVEASAGRPTLDLVGTASGQQDFEDDLYNAGVSAFARGRVPLFQGGLVNSRVRTAKLRREQARLQVQAAERDLRASLATAWFGVIAAERSIESSELQIDAAEIAFEGAKRELSVGTRTTLDVLDSEQDLLDARLTLVQAERDLQLAAYQVLQAIGGLRRDVVLPSAPSPQP
ncbi:MAG: TolC family outer membrane protein [Pseudomonadota bacterium]